MSHGPAKYTVVNPALTGRAVHPAPMPAPEKAGLWLKLKRARRELAAWAKEGAELAPRSVRQARLAICAGSKEVAPCLYYHAAGNLGLGECQAPGCGCTRVKLALASSFCPLNPPRWGTWKRPASRLQAQD